MLLGSLSRVNDKLFDKIPEPQICGQKAKGSGNVSCISQDDLAGETTSRQG
jgi:hypothetical protein